MNDPSHLWMLCSRKNGGLPTLRAPLRISSCSGRKNEPLMNKFFERGRPNDKQARNCCQCIFGQVKTKLFISLLIAQILEAKPFCEWLQFFLAELIVNKHHDATPNRILSTTSEVSVLPERQVHSSLPRIFLLPFETIYHPSLSWFPSYMVSPEFLLGNASHNAMAQ